MSYHIYYRSLFIKLADNEYIPIFQSGDSNTVYVNSNKKCRDWGNHRLNGKTICSKQEILDYPKQLRNGVKGHPEYSDESFGWFTCLAIHPKHTTATSYKSFENLFINGIKKAKTIEYLKKFNIHLIMSVFVFDDVLFKESGLEKYNGVLITEENPADQIEFYLNYYKDSGASVSFKFSETNIDRIFEHQKAERLVGRIVKKTNLTNYFVLKPIEENLGYFVRLSKCNIFSIKSLEKAKKYETEKQANIANDKITSKMKKVVYKVENINE